MASVEGLNYTMPLEVYLQSALIRGILTTNQDRLSNYLILREGQEIFSLREASLEDLRGRPLCAHKCELKNVSAIWLR